MIAQYTQAAIVSELKRLAIPASVDSIPSSAMQEDHVSMGWSAGAQAAQGHRRPDRVLAIELLTAARGLDMRAPLTPRPPPRPSSPRSGLGSRARAPTATWRPEIEAIVQAAASGELVAAAESVTGPLA